jgi:hypothetical protein
MYIKYRPALGSWLYSDHDQYISLKQAHELFSLQAFPAYIRPLDSMNVKYTLEFDKVLLNDVRCSLIWISARAKTMQVVFKAGILNTNHQIAAVCFRRLQWAARKLRFVVL